MTRSSIRFSFCLAVAILAAAIADPLVESASNAGWFGPGKFTDHSTIDLIPALLAGCFVVMLQLVLRTCSALRETDERSSSLLRASDEALGSGIARLLLPTFAVQFVVLFAMETAEQFAVWGHGLGGTIWLGGPVPMSLAAHAIVCVVVAFAIARSVRVLAAAAVRVIRLIAALATLPTRCAAPVALRRANVPAFDRSAAILCGIGERAPPLS